MVVIGKDSGQQQAVRRFGRSPKVHLGPQSLHCSGATVTRNEWLVGLSPGQLSTASLSTETITVLQVTEKQLVETEPPVYRVRGGGVGGKAHLLICAPSTHSVLTLPHSGPLTCRTPTFSKKNFLGSTQFQEKTLEHTLATEPSLRFPATHTSRLRCLHAAGG